MSVRNYSTVAVATTTTSSLTNSVTTIPVTALSGYPAAPFTGRLEGGTANEEIVTVTGVSGLNLTVLRGVDGSTAKSHLNGVAFDHAFSARDLAEPNAHVNASAGVHGLTGNVVGDTDVQTVSSKTLNVCVIDATSTIGGVSGAQILADHNTLAGSTAASTAFTPTITGLTLGNGTAFGKKIYFGKRLRLHIQVTLGSTSSVGATLALTLPDGNVTPNDAIQQNLDGRIGKTGFVPLDVAFAPNSSVSGNMACLISPASNATVDFYQTVTASVPATEGGGTTPWAVAGATFVIYGEVEVQ